MQKWLEKEKELRRKGVADKQIEETVAFLRTEGVETVWDVQAAYDSTLFGLGDRCSFGSHGLCCRNCNLGPCRLGSEELPLHLKFSVPKVNRSSCGKTADSMVAGMFLQTVLRGTSSHIGHALHVARTFVKAAEGSDHFPIKDEQKLFAVAKDLGINIAQKQNLEIAREIGQKAMEDLVGPGEGPMSFALALAPKKIEKLVETGLIPQKGAAETIVQGVHSTAQGMMSSTKHLLLSCLKFGVVDMMALYISTQLQDILLGVPTPKPSRIGMDALDKDKVNILVHGHVPVLSEMVIAQANKLTKKALGVGAKGINVVGTCCTGTEVLVRLGIPMAGSTIMQELVVGTGLVDAVCVDVQCVYPSLSTITQSLHTRLITTMPELRMDNDIYIEFTPDNAQEAAGRIVEEAIAAYRERVPERTFLPKAKGHDLLGGFSVEALMGVLETLNPEKPLKPLVDLIIDGSIQGVAVIAGCLSSKIQTDMSFVTIAKELLRNNILVLATGCAATACARHGLLKGEAKSIVGGSLRGALDTIGKAAGLNGSMPPILHFGSCVDNSRCAVLAASIADYLETSIDKLPLVASAAEHVVEKAAAIYMGVIALGITTHIGVTPKLSGSPYVINMLTKELEQITGSTLLIEIDPDESAKAMINHIQKKRKGLGI
ncbi:MAG: anaerobic carbon-monoxide dehydrogenase catalytic subunit [Candidatus Scalindua sp. AMX11]|nr:MAG: anaerobic carbon-monoxide dehydrogenase catalytic subunit [Candidatus Scalindua sp.]NOG85543.1 anaerobic carbon-monoxide dehydrogenase catalytic subunit [Planctomycetota bacterium]RZV90210.1 MAG: anaerobic carbon-monoxide dehydrogenase catalytic subunit [Candidatus Scalindua sp. SCAELEC01]TDE64994.1 MAG: anaerobic carbon-monoxide dehydrogenase catalytic subunit [Candidatus Scalindua sp. AMX11]GJQ59572.1 MAG: carbon-monoxide dehydrogenase catalytic subunit [Candidatus Scalindua sp.]